jgi:penicillin-binding protein 1A
MIELQPGKYRRSIIRLWKYVGLGLGLAILYIVAVSFNFFWLFGDMPDLQNA